MPQIDALISRIQENGAVRAVVQGDAIVQLELPTGVSEGSALSNELVEEVLAEILTPKASVALNQYDKANFIYYSPYGPFQIEVDRSGGVTRLEIEPIVPVAPPAASAPTAPAATPKATPPAAPAAPPKTPPPAPPMAAAPAASIPPPVVAPPYGAPPYGGPAVMEPALNNSGQPGTVLPPELRGFNWGGLFLSWVWAIGNGTWIGLLGLIPCVGFIMRFVLGFKGNEWAWRNKKWKSVQHFRTSQMVWGILGACVFLMSFPIYAAIMFPVFARARENARRSACQSNMKQITLAMHMFAEDNRGKCPSGTTMASWKTALVPYTKSEAVFSCPSTKSGEDHHVLNPSMSGANLDKIDNSAKLPVFFYADVRHLEGVNVAFADGHIKWFREDALESNILPAIESFIPDTRPSAE